MTTEDRKRVDELKESFREAKKELRKQSDIAAKERHIESVAKTEYLWELYDATEEDLPQLREWVEKRFSGSYHQYFLAYTAERADKGLLGEMYPGIEYQMKVPYDVWHEQFQQQEQKKVKKATWKDRINKVSNWVIFAALLGLPFMWVSCLARFVE